MAQFKRISFDRPLEGAVLVGQPGRSVGERELASRIAEAYRKGCDDTRAAADQQMVEFRHDIHQLSEGLLKDLAGLEAGFLGQIRDSLPALVLEIAHRLMAGFEPPAEMVEKLCTEALDQLFPERENLELTVCPRDGELLDSTNPDWRTRYPGLRIVADPTLSPGDCLVRSRFGLTDARRKTKLAALQHSMMGA